MKAGKLKLPGVASFTDAWIETSFPLIMIERKGSHLLQMRGLKQKFADFCTNEYVASFTDAWIETERVSCSAVAHLSHLLQMRGLKQPNQFLK